MTIPSQSSSDDPQRELMYEWEDRYFHTYGGTMSLEAASEMVGDLWDRWFAPVPVWSPTVNHTDGHLAQANRDKIILPVWARNTTIVTHELAHSIECKYTHEALETESHGPLYAAIFATLLSWAHSPVSAFDYVSPEVFKASMRIHGLRVYHGDIRWSRRNIDEQQWTVD